MWDKLEVTYEGTNKVKETHINMLVHDYELFSMKEGEPIEEMFARFSKIISDLKAFDNPYTNGDQVRKILRSLPTTWQTKVITLESQDLNKLSYDELRGELIAFERTHLKKTNQEEKKKMDILDSTLKESQEMMNELKRLTREVKDWKLKHEVCEIENDVLQEEFEDLQMQLNNMHKSTSHSSVRSNQTTYKSTGKEPARTKSTSSNTYERPINGSDDEFGNQKVLNLVTLTLQDPGKLGYLKESNYLVLQEHHRVSRKEKWYLDSVCSSHMTGDKNMFKEVTKIDGGSVKFGDDSKGKIVGTGTIPFNNNYNITKVYLVDGLNYNLLRISQLCDSGYDVKFKKIGCAIEDESGKIILPGKRYGNVYILEGFEKIDGHICLSSMSDDP
ncbi:uncharacterized protein LOC142172773 [Nicotiana tabacum]|uniref:Uncharacterized protein LOC142172773 n=1 Tax=Nicotiana tabacum TaxID=4097 RepID=A0AC58T5S0_TOBAC